MSTDISLITTDGVGLGSVRVSETDSQIGVLQQIGEICHHHGYELQAVYLAGIKLAPSNEKIKDFLLPAGVKLQSIPQIQVIARRTGAAAALTPAAEMRLKMVKDAAEAQRRSEERRELVSMAAFNIENDDLYADFPPMDRADVRFIAVSLELEPLFPGEKKEISLKVGPTSGYDLYTAFSEALHGIGKVCFLSMNDTKTAVPVLDDKSVIYNVYPFSRFFVNVRKLPSASARAGGRRRIGTRKLALSKRPRMSKSRSLKRKRSQKRSRARK
jgi:hypothetical protein